MAGVGVSTIDWTDTDNCTHAHTSQLNIVLFWGMSRWVVFAKGIEG